MKVAVLSGGRSSEHDVSLASGEAIRAGLAEAGHEVLDVEIGRDGVFRLDGEELALHPGRGLEGADVVFPALHGPFGEDGTVQGLLEMPRRRLRRRRTCAPRRCASTRCSSRS